MTVSQEQFLDAILPIVPFEGWSKAAFSEAAQALDLEGVEAAQICPRGATGLAVLFHKRGDGAMVAAMAQADFADLRFRDKVAEAIRLRLAAAGDKEVVRKGTVLFSLPHMAPEGAKLIWGTADAIWTALGDTSRDVNWYSKRATLSAVYASVVLYWLGDEAGEVDAFIDRRIENVMQFEKLKAQVNKAPLLKPFTSALDAVLSRVSAPAAPENDLPGVWHEPK